MPNFIIENEWNKQIKLTQDETRWQVTSVTGINPPVANIATSVIPTFDGSRFNSSRLEDRNVVISLAINGDAEANRLELNSVIMPKRYIKLYYVNKTKSVYIEGYVESFEYDVFEESKILAQASIICPDPYWKDTKQSASTFTPVVDLFEFPFSIPEEGIAISELLTVDEGSILNAGSIESGIIITIESRHKVLNPFVQNVTTGQKMIINEEISKGQVVTISTIRGSKSIRLYSDGVTTNILNDLAAGSKWITLAIGENSFTYGADYGAEDMIVKISYRNQYGGL